MPALPPIAPPPQRPLLPVALAVGLGIALDRAWGGWWLETGCFRWWGGAALCWLLALSLRTQPRATTGLLLAAALCCGGSWHHLRWHYFSADHIARFASEIPQPVSLRATALDRLKWSPEPPPNPLHALPVGPRSELHVRLTQIRDGTTWRAVTGSCKLRIRGELEGIMAGDQLQIVAQLARLAPAMNPGEHDWSLVERGAGHYCQLYATPECVTRVQPASPWSVSRWLHRLGERCEQRIATYVWPSQIDLAQALLLGARERLQPSDLDAFVRTGTIHLLVVSGFHLGLLALAVWTLVCSSFLPRPQGLLLTALVVIGYALITGARPPVVRAAVLVVMTLTAYAIGRRASPTNLLAAAALVVLAMNPCELFRSGTQLSFLCVATLIAYAHLAPKKCNPDPLLRLIQQTQPWPRQALRWAGGQFWELTIASLVIWLVMAPLVAHCFHLTSPVSILVTPLLWPLVAMALVTGLALCLVGWIVPPLAWGLGAICSCCLWSTTGIVQTAQQAIGGSFYLPGPPGWWTLGFYAGLLIAALTLSTPLRWRGPLVLAALWLAVLWGATTWKTTDTELRCTFLSVGHGTCVVLELPGGETWLYDAGSLGAPQRASRGIASFLWSRGITRIDAIVLSHADVDHYNALPELLARFQIDKVYVSPQMFPPSSRGAPQNAPDFLRQTLDRAKIPWQTVCAGDLLPTRDPEVACAILHPPRAGVVGSDNANSLLLKICFAGQSILLPGDLESPGIEAVTAQPPQAIDIVLVPHHGSRHSDPPGFAAWCSPRWVVVSGPRASADQHYTAQSYRDVGAQVWHTAGVGAVEFTLSKQGLSGTPFRDNR